MIVAARSLGAIGRLDGTLADGPAERIRAALAARVRAAAGRGRGAAPVIVKQVEALRDRTAVRRVLSYIGRLDGGEAERIIDETGGELDPEAAAAAGERWAAVDAGTTRPASPVLARHFVLSLPTRAFRDRVGEPKCSAETVAASALDALEAAAAATFGAWNHRYVAARHRDTAHPHLHVLVHWRRPGGTLLPLDNSGVGTDALRHAVAEAAQQRGFDVDGCRAADVEAPELLQRRRVEAAAEEAAEGELALLRAIWSRNRLGLALAIETWSSASGQAAIGPVAERLRREAAAPANAAERAVRHAPQETASEAGLRGSAPSTSLEGVPALTTAAPPQPPYSYSLPPSPQAAER